jgi:hypothetical protein
MKLYTEKQVVNAIQITVMDKPITYAEVLEKLTPIELPSDEEIRTMSLPTNVGDSYHSEYIKGFNYGAKWVIEQTKQQDNA